MPDFTPRYKLNILLADDDIDDCHLFKEALDELPLSFDLSLVHNGEQLMKLLHQKGAQLPDMLFLDLNMPHKNGFQCLSEIKQDEQLKQIPVIIYSTSIQQAGINLLYKNGAHHYIRKPSEFHFLKKLIYQAIRVTVEADFLQPVKEDFVLSV